MGTALLILLFIFVFLLFLLLVSVVGAAAGAVAAHRDEKNQRRAAALAGSSSPVEGIYADIRIVKDQRAAETLHYKLSVRYPGADGYDHRAYIGINAAQPLPIRVGDSVQLRIFPVPLIRPDQDALDPERGSDGMIRDQIRFCAWMGAPIDETGTVMREEDLLALTGQLRKRAVRAHILRNIMIVSAGATLVAACSLFFRLYTSS